MSGVAYNPDLPDLLARAAFAYRRRDDADFLRLMVQATGAAPHRLDLWFDLAHHHIQTDAPDKARRIFAELASIVPADTDVLTCHAHWERFAGDADAANRLLERLRATRPSRAEDLRRVWDAIDRRLSEPVSDCLPDLPDGGEGVVAVVLGYLLSPDGAMRQALLERLEKSLELASAYPACRLLVTGGVQRADRIEAREMRDWLRAKGVSPDRILEEGYARDIVENILYAREILDIVGAKTVFAVTAAGNSRRAAATLDIAGWVNGSSWSVLPTVAASGGTFAEFVDDGRDLLKLYRDTLRIYGIPMMRTYPELAER